MKVIFLVVLFFLAVSASKISEQLAKEISKSSEIDFVINLKNVQYRSLKHKGKSFESLDIETKAHFIVDSLINHAAVSQKNIESLLKEKNVEYSKLWIINSISVKKGSVSLINELSLRSDVESLTFDEKYTIADSNTKEISQEEVRRQRIEWNLVWVKADQLWKKGFTGKGKVVGLVDTGVNFRHPGKIVKN
jgi:subtilisin family serine protease